ncbi:MAG: TonB-dependent receptor [Acidobacteriota bacterium]|nr:TonB-dependent receptor [Acidobacteriota bacterium]
MRSKWIAGLLLLPGLCFPLFSGDFSGRVTYSGGGLPGATILLEGGTQKSTVTGKDGDFSISVPDGSYKLTITMTGFTTITEEGLNIGASGLKRDFRMEPAQYEELTVVSSSKVETRLIDAPATISVVSLADLENSVTDDFGDILRELPGVNVIQFSARDINVTSREETSSLSNTQLALLDGRTIYLDFFGIVLWDLLPTNMNEIKQIEVVRGPASAIWGANAQTGLVNIITKTPREMQGTSLGLNYGTFGRDVDGSDLDDGNSYGFDISHAAVVDDTWSYKISAGYFDSDPWARPTGIVPFDPEKGTGGFPYPDFENTPTKQPKIDFRLDQELSEDSRIVYGIGSAGTEGIIHSGIGPFDIQDGNTLTYGKVNYTKGNLKLNFFANILDGNAINVLTLDATTGQPIDFVFKTNTYDFEVGHSTTIGDRHNLTYGGNARFNDFELSLAAGEDTRNEFGAYFQDEIVYEKFRAVLGARFDKFDSIDDVVISPRLSFLYQPSDSHTFRLSYNEAFRAPSLIDNYLDTAIVAASLDLGLIDPRLAGQIFPVITPAVGNQDLTEDELTAYEFNYTGVFDQTVVGLSFYRNDTDNNMNFLNPPGAVYTSENPPPGWPLPPAVIDLLLQQGIGFPSLFTYQNLGPVRYEGIEFSVEHRFDRYWDMAFNWSWQDDPVIEDDPNPFPEEELSFPPTNRYNLKIGYSSNRLFSSLSWNHQDEFFSTDVLDGRFHGEVDAYDILNFNLGYRWFDNRLSANLKITNLADEDVQQHIFADIMKRQIGVDLRYHF